MQGFTGKLQAALAVVRQPVYAASVGLFLSACGGGGGDDSTADVGEGKVPDVVVEEPVDALPDDDLVNQIHKVAGTVSLPAGVTGDGENQFLSPTDEERGNDNDSPLSAFGLTAPATAIGSISGGNADPRDFFRVDLVQNQWVTLAATEASGINLDLFLYDEQMNLITAGLSPTALESLQVPSSETYFIEVARAVDAQPNSANELVKYRLDVLTPAAQPSSIFLAAVSYSLNSNIIPGQIIVTSENEYGQIAPQTLTLDVTQESGQVSRVQSKSAAAVGSLKRVALGGFDAETTERRSLIKDASKRAVFDTLLHARKLATFDEVQSAEPDIMLYASSLSTVNDSEADKQWGAAMVDVETAWTVTSGEGVTVAVVDTGFLTDHPDLASNIVDQYDFYDDDADASASPELPLHHGTHVAGIVGAIRNNESFTTGIAPNADLMPLRVLGDCLCGSLGDILQALRYAAGLPNQSGLLPAQTAKVANVSIELPYGRNAALLRELEQVTEAGLTVVWSAGNDSENHMYDEEGMSGIPGVIIVSAVGAYQALSSYSNYGSAIDLASPGGDVDSANGGRLITGLDGYWDGVQWQYGTDRKQGTSQAAPFVSGVIALMASVWDDLSPAAIDSLIEQGKITRDIGLAGHDDFYGAGIIDAGLAVQASLAQAGLDIDDVISTRIAALPNALAFSSAEDLIEVELTAGDIRAERLQLVSAPSWLRASEAGTFNGYGTWTVTVDRAALSEEFYQDQLVFSNGDRQLVVPVTVYNPVAGARSTGIGQVLVQFVRAGTAIVVHEEYALADANYRFEFGSDNVPDGRYIVRASSDLDGDNAFCEAGELCGSLPLGQEITVKNGEKVAFEIALQLK